MRQIFVDTSAWCAIEDKSDANHEASLAFKDEIAGACELVTTDYVLDETYTLLLLNIDVEVPNHHDAAISPDAVFAPTELARCHVALHDVDAVLLVEGDP